MTKGKAPDFDRLLNEAVEAANSLLNDSYECIEAFAKFHSHGEANTALVMAILTVGHALLTQRDIQYEAGIFDYAQPEPMEYWRVSDVALVDKAKDLRIDICPKYSMHDLRYLVDNKIKAMAHG